MVQVKFIVLTAEIMKWINQGLKLSRLYRATYEIHNTSSKNNNYYDFGGPKLCCGRPILVCIFLLLNLDQIISVKSVPALFNKIDIFLFLNRYSIEKKTESENRMNGYMDLQCHLIAQL